MLQIIKIVFEYHQTLKLHLLLCQKQPFLEGYRKRPLAQPQRKLTKSALPPVVSVAVKVRCGEGNGQNPYVSVTGEKDGL